MSVLLEEGSIDGDLGSLNGLFDAGDWLLLKSLRRRGEGEGRMLIGSAFRCSSIDEVSCRVGAAKWWTVEGDLEMVDKSLLCQRLEGVNADVASIVCVTKCE